MRNWRANPYPITATLTDQHIYKYLQQVTKPSPSTLTILPTSLFQKSHQNSEIAIETQPAQSLSFNTAQRLFKHSFSKKFKKVR